MSSEEEKRREKAVTRARENFIMCKDDSDKASKAVDAAYKAWWEATDAAQYQSHQTAS